jgi:hypothetical protein
MWCGVIICLSVVRAISVSVNKCSSVHTSKQAEALWLVVSCQIYSRFRYIYNMLYIILC